ncbi:hypothetical protein GBA52_029008 [Prunus armeniaca]|nr:hypothetical protein GBA52_029008 [Prunus armeniaca]
MNLSDFVAVFFLFLMWNFLLFGHGMAHTVTFDIRNKCPFPIWPATAPNNGQPVIADGGFYLPAGRWCPEELKVLNSKGEVVACKSACLAFNTDPFCCRNEYGTPAKCKPSVYSKIFKDACPSYYSYAYDSPPPLVTCKSRDATMRGILMRGSIQ